MRDLKTSDNFLKLLSDKKIEEVYRNCKFLIPQQKILHFLHELNFIFINKSISGL